jgi:Domain of unknown function (DUF5071)
MLKLTPCSTVSSTPSKKKSYSYNISTPMNTFPALNTRAHLSPSQIALLPKNKFDDAAINHIATLQESEVEPLLPEILTWLQDLNWPINHVVLPLLHRYPALIVEPVREILRTDDVGWIYFVLSNVVKEMPLQDQCKLRVEIERIAKEPTKEEAENEVDVEAQEILDGLAPRKEKN